ncbi:MAG TPA: alkaline phosphatase family protein [Acidobacteriaceae bacterium]|nr:alkaline phosphatase family protein [Acidobacteriaceae bacterium]
MSLCLSLLCGVAGAQSVPHSSHVWLITEENHSFEDVVGNSQMPYYNQLIRQYGLATQFYANQHSSLPALMWFVAGAAIEPNNDTTSCHHTEDNIVRELLKHGYTWRSYQENMPSAGFQGLYGGANNLYYRRHNPLIDFSDVCPGTGQAIKSVPFPELTADLEQGYIVNYAYITPDSDEDAHNGTLQEADQWLQQNLPVILDRPEFRPGGDGIVFVVWDEGNLGTDNRCSSKVGTGCGGRTATLVIGPQVKPGYQSTVTYHNENVLKTVCTAMGLATCPGAAQNAAPMADFFTTGPGSETPSSGVVISSPGNGATIAGAVHLIASASEDQAVKQTQVWDNGAKLGYYGTQIDTTYNLSPGAHATTVLDLDSSYRVIHLSTVKYNVQAPVSGVQVVSPTPGETVTPTVHIVGYATESVPIHQMQVWDNGAKLGWYAEANVNQYFSLAPGSHTVTILDLGTNNNVLHKSSVSYNVQ